MLCIYIYFFFGFFLVWRTGGFRTSIRGGRVLFCFGGGVGLFVGGGFLSFAAALLVILSNPFNISADNSFLTVFSSSGVCSEGVDIGRLADLVASSVATIILTVVAGGARF
jgi:hypothetical protein